MTNKQADLLKDLRTQLEGLHDMTIMELAHAGFELNLTRENQGTDTETKVCQAFEKVWEAVMLLEELV